MRPIDKFILHVVHNLFPLNEYSEGAIKQIMQQYREEADDLDIEITDDQLKKYIERFDVIKAGLISKGKTTDIVKQGAGGKLEVILPLSKLIKLVTASKGADIEDEKEDNTPDVVYSDNSKTIWNGSKEGNCITYGRGEKWCITRGSYSSYRYSSDRGYPTFYLAKNNNLADSNPLSFVAIQVRDPERKNDDSKYVYTGRNNRPYESKPMSFSKLTSEIPWLREIPNIESILKYIPLTSKEKTTQQYKFGAISIREWTKLPFEIKKQYLVIRKDNSDLFSDIDRKTFVKNYLPEYPQIAEFIAITPDIIKPITLLANLESFTPQDRKSITANLQGNIDTNYLDQETLPFSIKKLLVTLGKWDIKSNERMYVTKDGNAIVKLKFSDDDVSIGLYTEEDDYPKIKLNQRTSKYLLDYPELDKIPFNTMLKLVSKDVISKELLDKVIDNAKKDPNSAIIIKTLEDGTDVLVDSNSLVSYKIKDDKITKVPFSDEDVQKILAGEKDNESFQQNSLSILSDAINDNKDLPESLDKEAFISIISSIPYSKRKVTYGDTAYNVIIPKNSEHSFVLKSGDTKGGSYGKVGLSAYTLGNEENWRRMNRYGQVLLEEDWKAYFDFLRNQNIVYNDNELINTLKSGYGGNASTKKAFIKSNPPVDQNNRYAPVVADVGGEIYYLLLNKTNPRESFKISDNSGKLVKANVSTNLATRLLGTTTTPAAPGAPAAATPAAAPRRGRPAGGGQPRAAVPAAGGGDINVREVMQETGLDAAFLRLPRADYRRLNVADAVRVNPNGDRGAARRNNQLGNRGRVGRVISIGSSKIYIIRLANQQIVASINVQPGNRNYLLTGNENGNVMVPLNSPSDLLQALQQRNLAEIHNYLVNEYLGANPNHLTEFKQLLRKHINEKKNEQK